MTPALLSVEDAQARILDLVTPLPTESCPLAAAHGRWLATPLLARRTQPWADLSAMDGYALTGDGPWQVVRDIPAESRDPGTLAPGEAARIFTGAPLPTGADRILIQENAERDGDHLTATTPASPGQWIRPRANEFHEGALLADSGSAVTAGLIGLAASAGHGTLEVRRRPRVALIATGSELVVPGDRSEGLPSANSPMLAAVFAPVADVTDRGIVGDDLAAIRAYIAGSAIADVIVLTGGASVGDHDLVRPALEAEGWAIAFHKVAMKPGKPLMIATRGDQIAFGLPGNPVSAYVTALLFVLPPLRRLAGAAAPLPPPHTAILAAPLAAGGPRTEYLRGAMTADGRVQAIGSQDSAALSALARADCLIRRDSNAPPASEGARVTIHLIA